MFGFGLPELLIIGVVLIMIIAMIAGVVALTVFIARRPTAGSVGPDRVEPYDPRG